MGKFIVESAKKTYNKIDNENDQRKFLWSLREGIRGEVIAPSGNFEPISKDDRDWDHEVVNFLVDTSNGALQSMHSEQERNAFKQHLRNGLRKEFLEQKKYHKNLYHPKDEQRYYHNGRRISLE